MEQLKLDIMNELEAVNENEQVEKNIELFNDKNNPHYEEFIQDIENLKNKWINKIKNDKLDKVKIKKHYIEDNYWQWQDEMELIEELDRKIMIIYHDRFNRTIQGNKFINLDELEELIKRLDNIIDENGNIITDEKQIEWYGWIDPIEDIIEDFQKLTNQKTNKEKILKAWDIYYNEEDLINFVNLAGENTIRVYVSRGYGQGDVTNIIYDEKTVNEEEIKYIDCLAWGKGYDLEIIEGVNEDYMTIYEEFPSDEKIKEYVSNNLPCDIENLEVVED